MAKLGLFLLCVFVPVIFCNDFYISVGGIDTGGCGDVSTPCASLNFTLNQASNSDTIYFQEGTYWNQSISSIFLDNISVIGQGNVTFGFVYDEYTYDTFITVYGINSNIENLQFSGYYSGRGPTDVSLFLIVPSSVNENENGNIYYNFTDITVLNCSRSVIRTTNDVAPSYFGKIYLNNIYVGVSYMEYLLWSVLEAEVNGITINNCTAGSLAYPTFLFISITQQVNPIDMQINNVVVANVSKGVFMYYFGPFYHLNNTGGTDILTFNNFSISDSTGGLVMYSGANLVLTSGNVDNLNVNYIVSSAFAYVISPLSFTFTNSLFHQVTGSSILYLYQPLSSTVVQVDSLVVSSSAIEFNYYAYGADPQLVIFSNLQFLSCSGSFLVSLSANAIAQNITFNNCTGLVLAGSLNSTISNISISDSSSRSNNYLLSVSSGFLQNVTLNNCSGMLLFVSSNSSISNISISNSTCENPCVYLEYYSPLSIQLNDISLDNVRYSDSSSYDSFIFTTIIYAQLTGSSIETLLSNVSISNTYGFDAAFSFQNDLIISDSFTYNNVSSQNYTTIPLFEANVDNLTITLTTPLPPQLTLSDLFAPSVFNCTLSYLGFNYISIPSSPTFVEDSNFPWVWVVLPCSISLIAITVAVCFILYRVKSSSYSTIY